MKDQPIIISLGRGLKILEAFTLQKHRLALKELTKKTGLPKTTVYRLLHTLESLGYISFDSERKEYFLGTKVMSLGFTVLSNMDLRDKAYPYLKELSNKSNQNVNLGILDKTEVVYIERIKKRLVVGMDLHIGSRLSCYNTSIGRAILAFLQDKELAEIIAMLKKDDKVANIIGKDGEKLIEVLEKVRLAGYALNDGEFIEDLKAIAAPIFNHEDKVIAAINMPVFGSMISLDKLKEIYAPLLLNTSAKISEASGFTRRSR